jgi:crotonobetainyl-CoA:carnitine CoA-transferase CaiB-like acyl-CoA transferase
VSFAPVKNLREAFDDPHAAARGMHLVDAQGQEHIGMPIRFEAEPGRVNFALPELGEHNRQVLAGIGYTESDITALEVSGALDQARPAASPRR